MNKELYVYLFDFELTFRKLKRIFASHESQPSSTDGLGVTSS